MNEGNLGPLEERKGKFLFNRSPTYPRLKREKKE
jgi:hypothetical protein